MHDTEAKLALAEIRQRIAEISSNLPREISVASVGVNSKTPYLALWTREALIWRVDDLGRCASNALEANDLASATLLARAVFESAAMIWHLRDLIYERHQFDPDVLNNNLLKMLLGWKTEKSLPEAYNVLTLINKIDRAIPGARVHYDSLSETAHPNWSGVAGLYSTTIRSEYRTIFGRDIKKFDRRVISIGESLIASLEIFITTYNDISELMPSWIEELEAI